MELTDKRILVVDDTEFHRVLLIDMLEDMGFTDILSAKDGLEGVRMARYYKPDLVLLDLVMPNIDGYETCEKIRIFASPTSMPIIVITGMDRGESLQRIFDLGANDYFEKPFDPAEVSNRVLFYLEYFDTLKKYRILHDYIEGDLEVAKALQANIMNDPSEKQESLRACGLDFFTYYRPFDGIGGDSWSIFHLAGNDPVFLVCDISGHGINAAINNTFSMSAAESVFHLHSVQTAERFSPAFFMDNLNFIFSAHMQIGTFGAAICLSYNQKNHEVRYAGCAVPDIWLMDFESGDIERRACNGFPIGITQDEVSPICGTIPLKKNQLLLIMSDGIIESPTTLENEDLSTDSAEILPGEKMMQKSLELLQQHKTQTGQTHMPTKECIAFIIERYKDYKFDLSSDDVTLMAFQRLQD